MVDSKENYKFDLGVKELNSFCQCLRKYVGTVWKKYVLLFELKVLMIKIQSIPVLCAYQLHSSAVLHTFFLFSSSFCKLIYFMPLFSYHQTHACVRKRFLRQCQLSCRDQTKRIDYWGPLILSMNLFTCLCKY